MGTGPLVMTVGDGVVHAALRGWGGVAAVGAALAELAMATTFVKEVALWNCRSPSIG